MLLSIKPFGILNIRTKSCSTFSKWKIIPEICVCGYPEIQDHITIIVVVK